MPIDASHREDDAALRARLLGTRGDVLIGKARAVRDTARGHIHTFSPKVFIPLTRLCRDHCQYCTFSRAPRERARPYLLPGEVLEIARAGAARGCAEALFTLGDTPEARFAVARAALDELGYSSTIAYLEAMCALVLRETGLLPHVNAGVMARDELAALRRVSASQGLMLETVAERLAERGGPHWRSPDKHPAARLETIRLAGELAIPFTSGILIGIGETRAERLDALIALRDLHAQYGHIQEVIVQPFRAKPGTPMARAAEPNLADLQWTIAAARLILPADIALQSPPNLSAGDMHALLDAGIDDWGGVSPVTPDHVNPEAPWPELAALEAATRERGRTLIPRLPVYPVYVADPERWIDPAVRPAVLRHTDAHGLARDSRWHAGSPLPIRGGPGVGVCPPSAPPDGGDSPHPNPSPEGEGPEARDPRIGGALDALNKGEEPGAELIEALFSARGADVERVCAAADDLRRETVGDAVGYVVNRNINYTNICSYACGFCAFSKGRTHADLRGAPYDLDHGEIARRVREAVARGASEVCLQGGIHPAYDGDTYLRILDTVKRAEPAVHVHAFSPLEVAHGARTLGLPLAGFLERLRDAGLGSLPGTAAEILDDEVRAIICPDKLSTAEWLDVVGTAHAIGLRTTATIMFGHADAPRHWARHLLAIRDLQRQAGGFTEFVPLPFVHMEAPLFRKGRVRAGPTWREARLMHAVARLVLHPHIVNVQASWTKLGPGGAAAMLTGGANDLGGTLMNESISRAAGAGHGQELDPAAMEALIAAAGRVSRPRNTLYGEADPLLLARAKGAAPLSPPVLTAPRRKPLEIAA